MTKAFVFGKFLPFHKGHEAMMRFALTNCQRLTVLVCCSDKEDVPGLVRKCWIEKTFAGGDAIDVKILNYPESELPNTSVSSREVAELWSEKFKGLFPDYDLVITSEPYGDHVADFMGIRHVPFDMDRRLVPVSSTAVRNNLFSCWKFLPDSVKPDYAIKVVLLGTESTGKTTLAQRLAGHYSCNLVNEAGRDLIENSNYFGFDDLLQVAHRHAQQIEQAVTGDSPLTIIDTDIHITMSYARFMFHKDLPVDEKTYCTNRADLYLYLKNDIAYVQDGTRLSEEDRDLLDLSHREILKQRQVDYVEIDGDGEGRFEKAVEYMGPLLKAWGV